MVCYAFQSQADLTKSEKYASIANTEIGDGLQWPSHNHISELEINILMMRIQDILMVNLDFSKWQFPVRNHLLLRGLGKNQNLCPETIFSQIVITIHSVTLTDQDDIIKRGGVER